MTGRLAGMAALAAVIGWVHPSCGVLDEESGFERPPDSTYVASTLQLVDGDADMRVSAARVTPKFFAVIDRPLWLGRSFVSPDFAPGAEPVVILTHRLWDEQLGARPEIIGRALALDGRDHTVVGVMPAGIEWPPDVHLWTPEIGPDR